MNLILFAAPLILLGAVWLLGITTLSKGRGKLARRSSIALVAYGLAIVLVGQILEALNAIPGWIAGPEGYGVIVPLFFAGLAILLGLLSIAVNAAVIARHQSHQEI